MKAEILDIFRCPETGQKLSLSEAEYCAERVKVGWLTSEDGEHRYPIRDFVPRFVPAANYAANFGIQWNEFVRTQFDSHSGHPISFNRFWRATGWRRDEVAGEWVLDVGCGAGRFAEPALQAGAKVVALDYSTAVHACYANTGSHPNLHVVQGDTYALPLQKGFFPFTCSLGVLQHTPHVTSAFAALPPVVAAGGRLCVDVYWKRVRSVLHAKYLVRPVTKRVPPHRLFAILKSAVPALLPVSQALGKVPAIGRALKRLMPVADYTGVYPLTAVQNREWALLDTFDMLAPKYDHPQTAATVQRWFEASGFCDVEVFHGGHLVGRGTKPIQLHPLCAPDAT